MLSSTYRQTQPLTHLLQEVKAGPRRQQPGISAVRAVDVLDCDEEAITHDVLAGPDGLVLGVLARQTRPVADAPESPVQHRLDPYVLLLLAFSVVARLQDGVCEEVHDAVMVDGSIVGVV